MNNKPTLNLQEKRDIWQVLNATFSFIEIDFKPLYTDILFISAPFYLLAGISYSLTTFGALLGALNNQFLTDGRYSALQIFSPAYWLFLLALLIGWSLSCSVIGNHVLQYKLHGKGYDVAEARKGIWKDLWRVIFGSFLNILIIIAASLLFLIPGIYLAVANSLLTTILILDKDIDLFDAFSESRRLIRDNWWWAFLLGFLVSVIYSVFITVFRLPSSVLSTIIFLHTIKGQADIGGYEILFLVLNIIAYLGYALVAPVMVIPSCIYYYSLKEKKDHSALLEKIDNIGEQQAQPFTTDTKEDEGDF